MSPNGNPENRIEEIQRAALRRIEEAAALDELEAVRVDALGRKGSLAQFSKEFGKLSAEERASAGKALNAAKQELETAAHDFGGHRKEALKAVDHALVQLEKALHHDKK